MAARLDKQPRRYGIGTLLLVVAGSIVAFGLLGAIVAELLH